MQDAEESLASLTAKSMWTERCAVCIRMVETLRLGHPLHKLLNVLVLFGNFLPVNLQLLQAAVIQLI